MSADESHSAKVKAGMELSRQHKAGEHVEFVKECTRCRAEAKERGKRPAYPAPPDTTGDVSLGNILPPPPEDIVEIAVPTTENTAPMPSMQVSPIEVPGEVTTPPTPPMPGGKTPEEKEREHQEALKAAAEVEKEARVPIPPIAGGPDKRGGDADGELVFHVLADGFTVLGTVWYRGQEIGIRSGSTYDQLSRDLKGRAWWEMSDETQMERFGQKMFGVGPWPYSVPGPAMSDADYVAALNSKDPDAIRRYEKQQQRQTRPPVPSER